MLIHLTFYFVFAILVNNMTLLLLSDKITKGLLKENYFSYVATFYFSN